MDTLKTIVAILAVWLVLASVVMASLKTILKANNQLTPPQDEP